MLPALVYWRSAGNSIGAFWFAYILTRPLGASFADWLGKAHELGGVGVGTGRISLILAVLIVGFVAYLHTDFSKGGKSAGAAKTKGG